MDPCGLPVDLLRSCYSTVAKLVNGSDRLSTITWYFVDDSLPWFPDPTAVNSLNWVDRKDRVVGPSLAIGEQAAVPRPWYNGATLMPHPGSLPTYCGCTEWFLNGSVLLDSPRFRYATGEIGCCVPCGDCPQGCTPDYFDVSLSGFSDDEDFEWSLFNGDWHVTREDNPELPCQWNVWDFDKQVGIRIYVSYPFVFFYLTDQTNGDIGVPYWFGARHVGQTLCKSTITTFEGSGVPGPWPNAIAPVPAPCLCS